MIAKKHIQASLVINSVDSALINEIQGHLESVDVKRERPTRDIVTVLTIAASVTQLIKAVLELQKARTGKPDQGNITVVNIENQSLLLTDVNKEKLARLLKESTSSKRRQSANRSS